MGQRIAIIGLGRFGAAAAAELARAGHDVLGIDSDLSVVQRLSSTLTHVVQTDAIDQETLENLGLAEFDAGIIGITGHLETSILATLILKRLGVPRVVAKASSDLHGEILVRVGADQVIFPERDTGVRLAHSWASVSITDSLDIIEGYAINRVEIPPPLVGRTAGDVVSGAHDAIAILLLARGPRVVVHPSAHEELRKGDVLVVAGPIDAIGRVFETIGEARAR